jgi:hypothetical protein
LRWGHTLLGQTGNHFNHFFGRGLQPGRRSTAIRQSRRGNTFTTIKSTSIGEQDTRSTRGTSLYLHVPPLLPLKWQEVKKSRIKLTQECACDPSCLLVVVVNRSEKEREKGPRFGFGQQSFPVQQPIKIKGA